MKKFNIQVRDNILTSYFEHGPKFRLVETVARKLYVDTVGNFNRIAARYKGKTYLVQSDTGDLGDPFRADATYLDCLYIDLATPCQWNL
jgi:hypothetical protein